VRIADIPAGWAGAPESLVGKFRIFGAGLVGFKRWSLLAIFVFPFRHAADRFDMPGESSAIPQCP